MQGQGFRVHSQRPVDEQVQVFPQGAVLVVPATQQFARVSVNAVPKALQVRVTQPRTKLLPGRQKQVGRKAVSDTEPFERKVLDEMRS